LPGPGELASLLTIHELAQAPWTVNLSGYEEEVTFIFENHNAAYNVLLFPLFALGLDTFDAT
jgi:hypothetical protein